LAAAAGGYSTRVRVVVVGATGNVGTSLLARLANDTAVDHVLGLARRRPEAEVPKTDWVEANVESSDLAGLFRSADAVVHLAWRASSLPRPQLALVDERHRQHAFVDAVARASVPALVYASSVGAYSPRPGRTPADESWPVNGVATSLYSRHKAEVERRLDRFQRGHPRVRVVRLRRALTFKRGAAEGIRRLFVGPLFPRVLARPRLIPVVPDIPGLRFQGVHSSDVAEAYRLAVLGDARGAFNVAADPVLEPAELARLLGARRLPLPARLVRAKVALSWRAHLQPTEAGWFDLARFAPLLDAERARTELGWQPAWRGDEALLDLLAGLREGAGLPTPLLDPETGGPGRLRELATGIGRKEDA
jgi:UDP-glucose 4-epimerase